MIHDNTNNEIQDRNDDNDSLAPEINSVNDGSGDEKAFDLLLPLLSDLESRVAKFEDKFPKVEFYEKEIAVMSKLIDGLRGSHN